MSIFSSLVGSTSLTKKNASTKTMPAIGAIMLKRWRHDKLSMIKPESVGPMAGARPITIPTVPMAAPRLSAGKMESIIV